MNGASSSKLLLAVVALLLATPVRAGETAAGAADPPRMGVEALMERAERAKGNVVVEGIVTRVVPDRKLFALADLSDREEVERSGTTSCVTLPVAWEGEMPPVGSIEEVAGKLDLDEGGRRVFRATSVRARPATPPAMPPPAGERR